MDKVAGSVASRLDQSATVMTMYLRFHASSNRSDYSADLVSR